MAAIAEATGYSRYWIGHLIGRTSYEQFRERDARVIEVYLAGNTITKTAELTGVQRTQVGRIIQRAGVSRPPGPRPRS